LAACPQSALALRSLRHTSLPAQHSLNVPFHAAQDEHALFVSPDMENV
jgi:hypothetical protein